MNYGKSIKDSRRNSGPRPSISRRKLLRAALLGTAGLSIAAIAGMHYVSDVEPYWIRITHKSIPVKGLQDALDGFRIVQISDIHLYPFTKIELVRRAVAMANALKPDLIVLTGDYILTKVEAIFELSPVLGRLNARFGVYAVLGNHDLWRGPEIITEAMEKSGLQVLVNKGVMLGAARNSIYLAGLDDAWSGHPELSTAMAQIPPNVPAVLLMHEPDTADTLSKDQRVKLQLSGHSHGGQVRLPLIGALHLPRYGKKYDCGLYSVNGMWLYTSTGLGVIGPPVRFNCRPEIAEITLFGGA